MVGDESVLIGGPGSGGEPRSGGVWAPARQPGLRPGRPVGTTGGRTGRRVVLGRAAGLATALGTLELAARLAWIPQRHAVTDHAPLPDIQFDLDRYIPAARLVDGIEVRFGPIHMVFATARLARAPTRRDQQTLGSALATIEATYPSHPGGVIVQLAYGKPYFDRLPPGLVALHMPRLLSDTNRFVLEEAVPAPADVHPSNPGVSKRKFCVPVRIEANDLLFTLRGDSPLVLADALAWLGGSDTLAGRRVASPRFEAGFAFTSSRAMFTQLGLPRKIATTVQTPYHLLVHPRSPRWMGFVEQPAEPATPAQLATCQGADGIRLTTARDGDYFDNASIQHLSHDILDLQQFYDVDDDGNPGEDIAYLERVQYMFRSTPPPLARHVAAAHRSARATEGRPLHQRLDGAGYDSMDVPDGSRQPKLQFSMFVPTADHFQRMRRDQASPAGADNDLDGFVTATRRQNFLVPPRRHRAFPLLELR